MRGAQRISHHPFKGGTYSSSSSENTKKAADGAPTRHTLRYNCMRPYLYESNEVFPSARAVASPVQLQDDRPQRGAVLHHDQERVVCEARDQLDHHLSCFVVVVRPPLVGEGPLLQQSTRMFLPSTAVNDRALHSSLLRSTAVYCLLQC